MELQFTFIAIEAAIIKLFVLMLTGFFLFRSKMINEKFVDQLSLLLVSIIFPALIISKTITHFSFSEYSFWWTLPVAAIIFSLVGMLMGEIIHKFIGKTVPLKEFVCACGFQNCGYLPMNFILFAFAGAVADRLLVHMFLFITGFNILMWSLVPLFLSGDHRGKFNFRIFLNPPVIATIFSITWVAIFGTGNMPGVVMDPLRQLGQAAFPIAMLTLGAYLARYRAYNPQNIVPIIAGAVSKLILFPLLVLLVLICIPIATDYKFFLFLEAIMPTAVSLVVIGGYVDADNKFFSSIIFYTHLTAIITIPLWLGVYNAVIK